jgi:hypothetical protein
MGLLMWRWSIMKSCNCYSIILMGFHTLCW